MRIVEKFTEVPHATLTISRERIKMPEKKCTNCENMDFCIMYKHIAEIAGILNVALDMSIDEKTPFENIVDTMAHDCKRFKAI